MNSLLPNLYPIVFYLCDDSCISSLNFRYLLQVVVRISHEIPILLEDYSIFFLCHSIEVVLAFLFLPVDFAFVNISML